MEHLLSITFLKRLHLLREKLSAFMGKLEFFRASPSGSHITPEIESHRSYAQGEDIRYIDWNLYARLDRFFIKTVVAEEESLLHLVVDTSVSMRDPFPDKEEKSLELAVAIAYLILAMGNKVVIHSCSEKLIQSLEYMRGEKEIPLMIQNTSSVHTGKRTNLGVSLAGLVKKVHGKRDRVILITDLLDVTGYFEQLHLLQERGARIGVVQILNPREIRPTFRGNLMLVDPETGERTRQTVGYRKLKSIRKGIADHLEAVEKEFRSRGIPYLRTSSQSDFEEMAIRFMTLPAWRSKT